MNNIKKSFSIRDLENLSGIKAHTLRIWEKRYALLSPERTATNIRTYDLPALQKLLNVALLYRHGYKISKIASIPEEEIPAAVREIATGSHTRDHAMNTLKMAMVNFDQHQFQNCCRDLLNRNSFHEVFWNVFIPLLNELGLLWQTHTISPAQEHFISNLIRQQIIAHTENLPGVQSSPGERIYVLFLPENEIHEIGLLWLNYEILLRGHQTVYLGQSMPLEYLPHIQVQYRNLCFLSYFTIAPAADRLDAYIAECSSLLKLGEGSVLWLLGHQLKNLIPANPRPFVKQFSSIDELLPAL